MQQISGGFFLLTSPGRSNEETCLDRSHLAIPEEQPSGSRARSGLLMPKEPRGAMAEVLGRRRQVMARSQQGQQEPWSVEIPSSPSWEVELNACSMIEPKIIECAKGNAAASHDEECAIPVSC